MDLILVTAPTDEPVTHDELLTQMRIGSSDLIESTDYLDALITATREMAENVCRRAFITQQWALYLDQFPYGNKAIIIPRPTLQQIDSITYLDTDGVQQTLAPSAFVTSVGREPAMIVPAYGTSWPAALNMPGSVKITFTAGYGDTAADVPQSIRQWILMNAAALYENREAVSFVPGSISKIDAQTVADALLASHRVITF